MQRTRSGRGSFCEDLVGWFSDAPIPDRGRRPCWCSSPRVPHDARARTTRRCTEQPRVWFVFDVSRSLGATADVPFTQRQVQRSIRTTILVLRAIRFRYAGDLVQLRVGWRRARSANTTNRGATRCYRQCRDFGGGGAVAARARGPRRKRRGRRFWCFAKERECS